MDFNTLSSIRKYGFEGFIPVYKMTLDQSIIPETKGVYMVLYNNPTPEFLTKGTGGFFKGKDPNVSIETLKQNWVNNTKVVYIGKSGGVDKSATLKSRIKQLIKFGQGKNVGHYGGRLIWQLKNSNELILCWKQLPYDDPREIQKLLICNFDKLYGKRPYANLKD
ncbi:hypothetical protein [Bacillus sp. MRMR6]|uniref:hypothetical protein n=1 Tax=Bacillus sp. MRMR6 TaxID=1928617 RepID=UPI0009526FF5|nr:hypothetical protein [Bacillus sp. MRMR6]OLS40817.1 hypothetical protein BTR25_07985 [Bacillus sp. MRMR6]